MCLVVSCLMSAFQPVSAAPVPKRILIVNSYNENAPWVQDYLRSFMLTAAQNSEIACELVHMNSSLIRTDSMYMAVADGIFERFRRKKPDYMIVIGRTAFSLRDRMPEEWGDVPMIYISQRDRIQPGERCLSGQRVLDSDLIPVSDIRKKYNFTYIEVPTFYKETIDMMVRMQPGMKKLVFAADELPDNMVLDEKIKAYVSEKYPHLTYEWLVASDDTRSEMQSYLVSNDLSVGLLLSSWYYARQSAFGYPMLVVGDMRLMSTVSRPVFALQEAYLDYGAVGGFYPDKDDILDHCRHALNEMLAGVDMRTVPFYYPEKKLPKVNYSQLLRAGIPAKDCPEDTVFVGKPKTLWESYSWLIISVAILTLSIIVAFITYTVFQRRKIRMMAMRDMLLNSMPICYIGGKVTTDSSGKPVKVDFTSGNYEADKLLSDNMTGKNAASLFDMPMLLELLAQVFSTGKSVLFTHYFEKTGKYYDFLVCKAVGEDDVCFFGMDVTDKKEMDLELKETSWKLEMTLGVARIIPWIWDLESHTIACEQNLVMRQIQTDASATGDSGVHIISEEEYFNNVHPDDVDYLTRLYRELIEGQKRYIKCEYRVLSDGEGENAVDWMEVNASVLQTDTSGKPVKLLGSMLMITARKRQEERLVQAKEAAKESDRLKSAFLANMSHEIRTPLNAIVGFSNLLATTDDEEQKQQFVNIIDTNNQLLLQLVADILDLSKVEANTLEFIYKSTDLNELLRGIEATVKNKVKPGVTLNYSLGADNCMIETEPNRLSQVMINLLVNACKFTDKGSVTYGYEIKGRQIRFFVRDTGCGISPEGQKRVFQRFVKLNDFAQGTGLGLTISQSIVKKLGGEIGVESEGVGHGSTFWFTVPYTPSVVKEKEKTVDETPKEVIEREKITILVAEDNDSNFMLFDTILGQKYHILHAWDGIEAVEMFDKYRPQLVLMDINMPRMNGYEATAEIRKRSSKVPIIAVTAYAYASDKERVMDSGFNGYVSKPIDAKRLDEEMKNALGARFLML